MQPRATALQALRRDCDDPLAPSSASATKPVTIPINDAPPAKKPTGQTQQPSPGIPVESSRGKAAPVIIPKRMMANEANPATLKIRARRAFLFSEIDIGKFLFSR